MPKNFKAKSQLRRRAARFDCRPGRGAPIAIGETRDGCPVRCGKSPQGWPVHVYRLNSRVGDRCLCGEVVMEVAAARSGAPTRPDVVCEHGTAMDVHCCNCHSGFIFDKDHECPPTLDELQAQRDELLMALEQYGAHDGDTCGFTVNADGSRTVVDGCTCGLDAMLAKYIEYTEGPSVGLPPAIRSPGMKLTMMPPRIPECPTCHAQTTLTIADNRDTVATCRICQKEVARWT